MTKGLILLFLACLLGVSSAIAADYTFSADCPKQYPSDSVSVHSSSAADMVLLVPGAGSRRKDLHLGHLKWGEYYGEVQKVLASMGIENHVLPSDINGNYSVEQRAKKVARFVKRWGKKGKKVLLFGHSMGGLAVRVALRDYSIHKYLSAVITVSTPHRGTPLVDFLLKKSTPLFVLRRFMALLGYDETQKKYLKELSEEHSYTWNTYIDSDPKFPPVYTVLVGDGIFGLTKSFAVLSITGKIIKEMIRGKKYSDWEKRTDGLVPIYSQFWGACLAQIKSDHASIIGKTLSGSGMKKFKKVQWEIFTRVRRLGLLK
ncbi:MAG: alpha/beta hydrolase [Bacteriovoracaceae bacterium]|jgi:hypothetical protein|nr:alpha/beta hydrolase [Bacteriovoracaceae bacterium]